MIEVPLQLWNRPHWELKGQWDSALFFRNLLKLFPGATTLFIEGATIAHDVVDFLNSAMEAGDYLPKRQTLWPRPRQYRLRCDSPVLTALAELAERHAEPELMGHLFVYEGVNVLLEFPDAFGRGCPAYFCAETAETLLRTFAGAVGRNLTGTRPDGRRL